jgi:hypothetical protein
MDGWMNGWHGVFIFGIGFDWDSHAAWVGWRWIFAFQFHSTLLMKMPRMLLMRRTGWARTYISHGNGWNDMGMVSMAGLSGTHTLLSREKGSLYTQFSQISMTGANVGAVQ